MRLSELQQLVMKIYDEDAAATISTIEDVEEWGDTLLLFLVREASDADNLPELIRMVDLAGYQLTKLSEQLVDVEDSGEYDV
jgi:hypothetical protein